jgi:hypothetical protein
VDINVYFNRFIAKSKQEFLDEIKKASIIIVYANTRLPVFKEFVCSIGSLNIRMISYGEYEVLEVLPHMADLFKQFWSKEPEIKYYFIDKLSENDGRGAVIPAKSNELVEKMLEDNVK